MSSKDKICEAINGCFILQFVYEDELRKVEPHQLAYNKKDNLALSAWWVGGYSKSGETAKRWREYLVEEMSSITVLEEQFSDPRPGYRRTPNDTFHSAICEL